MFQHPDSVKKVYYSNQRKQYFRTPCNANVIFKLMFFNFLPFKTFQINQCRDTINKQTQVQIDEIKQFWRHKIKLTG